MSELAKTAKIKKTFKLVDEINQAKMETVKGFLIIGRNLDIIQKEKLWGYYGEHIVNFGLFLREVGLKHATAWNCVRIWRIFGAIMTSKNLYAEYFRLVRLLPVAKDLNENQKEEWLLKANDLTPQGFEDEIREAKGQIPTDQCEHNGEFAYYKRCKICNKFLEYNPENGS